MPVINRFADLLPEITEWRRDIHTHPELQFDVQRTAGIAATKLREFGADEVVEGIGQTGVVGIIKGRNADSGKVIGLRADMDALPILEATQLPHASTTEGKMHACGHDGHTAMLLGAAKYLCETRNFNGTVAVIFQPAEEGGGPHTCVDTTVAAAHIMLAIQSIASRNVDPLQSLVISVTSFQTDTDAFNVIPQKVQLKGTVRTLSVEVQDMAEKRLGEIVEHTATAMGCKATLNYQRNYPVTINAEQQTKKAVSVAQSVAGDNNVNTSVSPVMGAEDFSFMLNARPGAFIFTGNGDSATLHHPEYDFNDEAIPHGCSYWVQLVEQSMPA